MAESKKEDSTAVEKRQVHQIKISGAYRELPALQEAMQRASQLTNLLSPEVTIQEIPLLHQVSLRLVRVDPPVKVGGDRYESPDIYQDESNRGTEKWTLTGRMLEKIAACAGISWYPMLTGRLDDGSDPHYRNYRAAGWLIDFDGSKRDIHGEKEVDLRDGSSTIAGWTKQRLDRARQHILALAESKAKNRAIRKALAIKSSYTLAELKKPFTIPKLVLDPQNHPDLEVRRAAALRIIDRGVGVAASLYGPGSEAPALPSAALADQRLGSLPPPPLKGETVIDADDDDTSCGCPDAPRGEHLTGCKYAAAARPTQTDDEPF